MLFTSRIPLFASTLLFASTTKAAPTRTHCRCTVVADTPATAISTPSVAHWSPAEPSPSPIAADICSSLGPELENFQLTKPELYESYLPKTEGWTNDIDTQRPLTTKVLVNFAAGHAFRIDDNEKVPGPTIRPHQRIVCRSEPDPFTEYQGSFVTLWILQVIIAVAILACIAEGLHLSMRWYGTSNASVHYSGTRGLIRPPGSEKLVLEISQPNTEESEKCARTYASTPLLIVQAPNGDRVCISYEEDDDDEMNRPVM